MEGRIVICFRAPGGPGRGFLERARALDARARGRGGALVAWDATRISYAFDANALPSALALAAPGGDDTAGEEAPFAVGVAEGELLPLADDGSRGELAWGLPIAAATALASAAKPGEILCAEDMRALSAGELLTTGARRAEEGEMRVRGLRVDPHHPWRKDAVEQLSRMRVASRVGVDPMKAELATGSLLLVRADPGTGGTRWLTDLAASSPRALLVSPSGSGFEPLGALRRAFARSITRELNPLLLELAEPLETLLSGDGVSLEVAIRLLMAFLSRKAALPAASLLLIDDAKAVDPASLEVCVRATASAGPAAKIALVVRLDATSGLPSVLAMVPKVAEMELAPLGREASEALAGGCTNDALDPVARGRWARLGANVALGIVEAIAHGIVSGELAWEGDHASPRSRRSGRGTVRPPADWILLRARDESASCRLVLGVVALLGGEARVSRIASVLDGAGRHVDIQAVVEELVRARWLVDTQEDWVALPSRTHRDTLVGLLDDSTKRSMHAAAAEVIEAEEGVFGQVEAAWHAAQGGDGVRAARVLLAAGRRTADAGLEASTTQLIAFARRADPSCEDAAMELLSEALARSPSASPPPISIAGVAMTSVAPLEIDIKHDSEPPTIARVGLVPVAESGEQDALRGSGAGIVRSGSDRPPDSALTSAGSSGPPSGATIATRLGELAKEALLSADNAALERWVDGLRAAGESPVFTERMRAMARLGRGDIGDALRVLRRTRAQLDPSDHRRRCQTSLAIGVALSVAGRAQEALLEGMDALGRARQIEDARGAQACLAFLAKLYSAVQRPEEADKLRAARAT